MNKVFIFLFVISSSLFAGEVTPVVKGEKAPSDGYFVTEKQMKRFIEINEENKVLTQQVLTLKDLAANNEIQLSYYKKRVDHLESELSWSETKGYFKTGGGFIVGVLATSVSMYAALQVTK